MRTNTADRRLGDGFVAGQPGAWQCQGHVHTGLGIGGSTDNFTDAMHLAGIDVTDAQLIRLRMRGDGQNAGDDDVSEFRGNGLDRDDFDPGQGQALRQIPIRQPRRDPFAQPLEADFHVRSNPQWLAELAQKAQIVFIEQSQVVDAVAQHGQSFYPEAESKTGETFAIDANVAEDLRVHHATAKHLQPAGLLAHATTFGLTDHATDIDFSRRLGEREIGRTETDGQGFLEEILQKSLNTPLRSANVTCSSTINPSIW